VSDLIKRLRQEYKDSTFATHNTLSMEPRYECEYCSCVELAENCHDEGCIALLLNEAADALEQLNSDD